MTVDNQRLLQYSLYGLGVVVWFIIWRLLGSLVEIALLVQRAAPPEIPLVGSLNNLAALVALGLTAAVVEYARRHKKANKFGVEVVSELRKVTWPTWKDVKGTTLVVIGVTFVVAIILFAFDKFYELIMATVL